MSGKKSNQLVIGDADALIALAHQEDSNHAQALKCLETLEKRTLSVIYPATAFAEALTVAERKMKDVALAEALLAVFESGDLEIVGVDGERLSEAVTFFRSSPSRKDTFFDAIVCATAKHWQTKIIFSFDQGYQKHGFALLSSI